MTDTRTTPGGADRTRRRRTTLALAAVAATLPSSLWRLLMLAGVLPGTGDLRDSLAGQHAYVIGLSVVELAAAVAVLGVPLGWYRPLVDRGLVPRWLPAVVGALGGAVITWLFSVEMVQQVLTGHRPDQDLVHGGAVAVMLAAYLPVVAWGPLTLAVCLGELGAMRGTG